MSRTIRFFSAVIIIVSVVLPAQAHAATYEATAIVDFFCEEAGKTLAMLAWKDKMSGVSMTENMHHRPVGFLQQIDNEIIRMIYRRVLTEDEAKKLGFRICVALMVNR